MHITTWALDDGYGDLKGHNGSSALLVPSFCTGWRPHQKSDFNSIKIDPYSHITVEVEGNKRLIGRGALEQDTKLNWTGGENKHLDQNFPTLLNGMLAIMAGELKSVTLAPLVMGLPVKAGDSEDRTALLKRIVAGKRDVLVTLATGKQHKVTIDIKEVLCKKQPFGSFCDIILDKTGNIINKKLAQQFNVVVDIGARTLNIYTLDALQPIYDLCDTTNDGVYSAYRGVKQYIETQLGQQIPEGKLPYIINKGEIRGIPLKGALGDSYNTLANIITTKIETLLVDSWVMVDNIIFTGGGSVVLRPWLDKILIGKPTTFLGRYSTARGLFKYGVRSAKKTGLTIQQFPDSDVIIGESR